MRTHAPPSTPPNLTALSAQDSKKVIEALSRSKLYLDFERSFVEATGLPLALRPVETSQLALHGKKNESLFCAAMAGGAGTCRCCLETQQTLAREAYDTASTVTCCLGLNLTAVPVRLDGQLIGFLQTGEVFFKPPTAEQFEHALAGMGDACAKARSLQNSYLQTRVVPPESYNAMIGLLTVFAEHLGLAGGRIVQEQQEAEPPVMRRARQFIEEHYAEDISLGQAAELAGMSTFHFCKMFRKATGMTFVDYVTRVRIDKARNLLLNPSLRVHEIAAGVGFQSLTHFNRVYKKVTGHSPSQFREQLVLAE